MPQDNLGLMLTLILLDLGLVDEAIETTQTWIGRWVNCQDGPRIMYD